MSHNFYSKNHKLSSVNSINIDVFIIRSHTFSCIKLFIELLMFLTFPLTSYTFLSTLQCITKAYH